MRAVFCHLCFVAEGTVEQEVVGCFLGVDQRARTSMSHVLVPKF